MKILQSPILMLKH